jgi:hypothetical protein
MFFMYFSHCRLPGLRNKGVSRENLLILPGQGVRSEAARRQIRRRKLKSSGSSVLAQKRA